MLSEQDAIDRLKSLDFCFFVGAGVSRSCGVPLGPELGAKLLEALGLERKEAESLSSSYHLERMLYLLRNFLGDKIYEAYTAIDTRDYAENHSILAEFHAQRGIPILTTNQDLLIETAAPRQPSSSYVKVHGTLNDLATLRVTLDRVSFLDNAMYQRLKSLVKKRIVIVIGYSFSDYDLLPFFESINESIYCLDHNGKGNDVLRHIIWKNDPRAYDEQRFASSAESFLPLFGKACGLSLSSPGPSTIPQHTPPPIDARIKAWGAQFSDYLKTMATSSLYQGMWQGKSTLSSMTSIANDTRVPSIVRALAFAEASRAAEGTASYRVQLQLIEQLNGMVGVDLLIRRYLRHIYLAAYYHIRDNPLMWCFALWHFSKAGKLHERVVQSDPAPERRYIYQSYRRTIDHGLASTLEKLGRLGLGSFVLRKADSLMRDYLNGTVPSDLDFMCEVYFVHAKLRIQERTLGVAEQYYSKALEVARWIRKTHSIDQALRGLAKVYTMLGQYSRALRCLDESLPIAQDTHEPILVGRNFLTRWRLLLKAGDQHGARKAYHEGERIYIDRRGQLGGRIDAFCYGRLGR